MMHDYHLRDDDLAHCKICDGAESSLPSECPGDKMTVDQQADVANGVLDFDGEHWMRKCADCDGRGTSCLVCDKGWVRA